MSPRRISESGRQCLVLLGLGAVIDRHVSGLASVRAREVLILVSLIIDTWGEKPAKASVPGIPKVARIKQALMVEIFISCFRI